MRCAICDAPLSSINFNKDHGDIDPCFTCLEVINNVFGDTPEDDETSISPEEAMSLEAVDEPTTEELMNVVEDTYYGDWSNR